MTKNRFYIIALGFLMFQACADSSLVDDFVSVPNQAWDYSFKPTVPVVIQNPDQDYAVYLNLRHTSAYPYSNLFVKIVLKDSLEQLEFQRIELTLAESDGKWTGKAAGSLYTHQFLVSDDYRFPDTGTFHFELEQDMRQNPLPGIDAVGLRIIALGNED